MEGVKQKVSSSLASPHIARYFHQFNTYRVGQLTTGNLKAMRESSVGASSGTDMVHSDIQPHAVHRFPGDKNPSIVVAVPRQSKHYTNVADCGRASLMVGHTDPQLFHWFRQLGCLPPRSILSGKAKLLDAADTFNIWDDTFVRHPVMHELAQRMWEADVTKTPEEKERIAKREREEDDKRMKRMTHPDWRAKQREREQCPKPQEDEERPIYVMKSESFGLVRIEPDMQLWGSYQGPMKRIWESEWPPMDPVARAAPRFIRMCNTPRAKFLASLNMNYNMKLLNYFVFDVDKKGLWAMGTQENFSGEHGEAKENWTELRIDFGKDQVIETEAELEWWFKGLMRHGVSETTTTDADMEERSEEVEFKHS